MSDKPSIAFKSDGMGALGASPKLVTNNQGLLASNIGKRFKKRPVLRGRHAKGPARRGRSDYWAPTARARRPASISSRGSFFRTMARSFSTVTTSLIYPCTGARVFCSANTERLHRALPDCFPTKSILLKPMCLFLARFIFACAASVLTARLTAGFNVPRAPTRITARTMTPTLLVPSDDERVVVADGTTSAMVSNDTNLHYHISAKRCQTSSTIQNLRSPWFPKFRRFKIRLDTLEDKFDIHKISSAGFVLSSTAMVVAGCRSGFAHVPAYLESITWVYLVACFVQGVTSLQMTMQFRKGDPVVQRGFISMALGMFIAGWNAMYFSPFSPDALNNFWVGNGVNNLIMLPIVIGSGRDALYLIEGLENRARRKKEKGGDLGVPGDVLSYGAITIGGFIVSVLGLALMMDPSHDRQWILHAFNEQSGGMFVPYNYYNGAFTGISLGYSALAITLRDKKLISKAMEQIIVGMAMVPLVVPSLLICDLVMGL